MDFHSWYLQLKISPPLFKNKYLFFQKNYFKVNVKKTFKSFNYCQLKNITIL